MGESLYAFFPRTVWGSLKSAWELEAKRYRRKGTAPVPDRQPRAQRMAHVGRALGRAVALLGWEILPVRRHHQGVLGFTLLEVVNYLEHYGMLRQKVGRRKQRYERVLPSHSWN